MNEESPKPAASEEVSSHALAERMRLLTPQTEIRHLRVTDRPEELELPLEETVADVDIEFGKDPFTQVREVIQQTVEAIKGEFSRQDLEHQLKQTKLQIKRYEELCDDHHLLARLREVRDSIVVRLAAIAPSKAAA